MLGCTNVSIRHNQCTVRDTAATRQHTNQQVDVRLTLSNRRCRCGEGEHAPSALNYPGPIAIYLSIHISISLAVSSRYIFSVVGINDRLLGDWFPYGLLYRCASITIGNITKKNNDTYPRSRGAACASSRREC